jgi:riboflavin kinase/FMN adenylyltransferase
MLLVTAGGELPSALRGGVVAIGNFDGLHRGHQKLLEVAEAEARHRKAPWGVVTFEPHPRSYFKPSEPVFRLTPRALKARLIRALGAPFLIELDFDEALSNLEPDAFAVKHLVQNLGASHVVSGYDFHFGKGRKGSPDVLRQLGVTHGFGVTIVDQVTDEGDQHSPFSSSSIRQALRHGHMRDAGHELGYHWTVMGEVVHGDQRGRAIGFPTLNIIVEPGADPYRGIYAMRVRDAASPHDPAWMGAGYFGDRPTFDTGRTFLEVHLIGFDGDLYGRTMLVELVDLIRGDKRFTSVDDLVRQMHEDCTAARQILTALENDNPLTGYRLGQLQQQGMV